MLVRFADFRRNFSYPLPCHRHSVGAGGSIIPDIAQPYASEYADFSTNRRRPDVAHRSGERFESRSRPTPFLKISAPAQSVLAWWPCGGGADSGLHEPQKATALGAAGANWLACVCVGVESAVRVGGEE